MKTNIIISLIFTLAFVLCTCTGCKKNPVTPPDGNKETTCSYPPGNRNYNWRMDTVGWFPTILGGVWAFSDTDAYLMGYIGESKPPYNIFMALHWNGVTWDTSTHGSFNEIKHYSYDVAGDDHFMVSVGYWHIGNESAGLAEFNNISKTWKGYQFQTKGSLYSVWTDGKGFFIAAGDNGMIYTKDGYSAEWVYSKGPTDFGFVNITGISKDEIYLTAYQSLNTGEFYTQGWKIYKNSWFKLFDTRDTSGTPLHLVPSDYPSKLSVWRCNITDSLKLYVIGDQSYLFESKGQQLDFKKTNLSDLGLPLKADGRTGIDIYMFSPNDLWIIGTRYNFYHWNGADFQRIIIPGLPNDDIQFGIQRKMIKTSSGKIFFPNEVSQEVYVMERGTP